MKGFLGMGVWKGEVGVEMKWVQRMKVVQRCESRYKTIIYKSTQSFSALQN